MYKNMKIEINEQQPLNEVVVELNKKGLHLNKRQSLENAKNVSFIGVFKGGWFEFFSINHEFWDGELITLAELKEMKC